MLPLLLQLLLACTCRDADAPALGADAPPAAEAAVPRAAPPMPEPAPPEGRPNPGVASMCRLLQDAASDVPAELSGDDRLGWIDRKARDLAAGDPAVVSLIDALHAQPDAAARRAWLARAARGGGAPPSCAPFLDPEAVSAPAAPPR